MLKDFIKIQIVIVLILILNVVATKEIKLPENKAKNIQAKNISKKPMQLSYLGKSPTVKALLKITNN
jgi:hypothetical protein